MTWLRHRKDYLSWEDYSARLAALDHARFVSDTARRSLQNFWEKRRRTHGPSP